MTSWRRTSYVPIGRPVAGELQRINGVPSVPIELGPGEELILNNPSMARDLLTAVAAGVSVLESEHGMPAPSSTECACDEATCGHAAARARAEDDRDAFRGLLVRMASAHTYVELMALVDEGRAALERYDRREAVTSP
ncbi:hypothetical protein [Nonomuraea sp. 10N515B]|uniref:hypothetical protein n=1 Tax=Nonomuraea sp. 10N515B TaxID=3457422 RepID=UPI003FCCD9A3